MNQRQEYIPNTNRKTPGSKNRKNRRRRLCVQNTRFLREPPLCRMTFRSPDCHCSRLEKQTVTLTRKTMEKKPHHALNRSKPHVLAKWSQRPEKADDCNRNVLVDNIPAESCGSSFANISVETTNTRRSSRAWTRKSSVCTNKTPRGQKPPLETSQGNKKPSSKSRRRITPGVRGVAPGGGGVRPPPPPANASNSDPSL